MKHPPDNFSRLGPTREEIHLLGLTAVAAFKDTMSVYFLRKHQKIALPSIATAAIVGVTLQVADYRAMTTEDQETVALDFDQNSKSTTQISKSAREISNSARQESAASAQPPLPPVKSTGNGSRPGISVLRGADAEPSDAGAQSPWPPPVKLSRLPDASKATTSAARSQAAAMEADEDVAISAYSEAIRREPNARLYIFRGNAFAKKHDLKRAILDYSQAILLDPKATDVFIARADAYKSEGDFDRAIADYGEAIRLDPKPSTFLARARTYSDKGDLDSAIADYSEAIGLDPKAGAFVSRGDAYKRKGNINRAIADYDTAIALIGNNPIALRARSEAYLKIGDRKRAVADLEQAARIERSAGISNARP